MRSSSTLGFQQEFDAIRHNHENLTGFPDPGAVLDMLHGRSCSAETKNCILISLIKAAQTEMSGADCALNLVLLALWPGLDAIMRRSLRRKLGCTDELPSEILARATEAIRCLDLGRVNWIATTVLRNIERDIVRACQREARRQQQQVEIKSNEPAANLFAGECGISRDLLHDEIRRIIGPDAWLVIRVAIEGFSQTEAAVELGLSESAARKRYQRAIGRLRDEMKKICDGCPDPSSEVAFHK
jgi:RNA polymerase sigma-70 factor (ECF subfamily)